MQEIKQYVESYYDFWFGTTNLYENWAKKYGLTNTSLFVLDMIHKLNGYCIAKDICERLLFPKQTVNSILKRFVEFGWIILQPAQHDKRNKVISLTPAGMRYADDILKKLYQLEETAMQKLSAREREEMKKQNAKFLHMLQHVMEEQMLENQNE